MIPESEEVLLSLWMLELAWRIVLLASTLFTLLAGCPLTAAFIMNFPELVRWL